MTLFELYKKCGLRVTTDSRAIQGGEIFFALKGENFDGNQYAMQALESGAEYAVVSNDAGLPDDSRLIKVDDPFKALQELAVEYRKSLNIPVIGLTGTNGKTTTKELIREVLSKKFNVSATKGNLNNDIGVPLTVLSIPSDAQIAVVEMGASHPDDIAKLVPISRPDYGLITNVGKAHLLGFGSFEGVKAAKGELYKWLGSHEGSRIFLNADDKVLSEMASKEACHVWSYGLNYQGAEVLPSSAEEPYLRIRLGNDTVNTLLVGAYNATNVLAAIAVGEFFGVSRKDAIDAIASYVPSNARSQMVRKESNTLIVDAYNANPSSMSAALDNFATVESDSKWALLGDMRELGEDSGTEHRKIVERLSRENLNAYLVGDEFRKAAEGTSFKCFDTSDELAEFLKSAPLSSSVVLVKGSRGIRMEKVLDVL